jgi:hypothetical protein
MALENAPELGCFGSVLYHDASSKRCEGCAFLQDCTSETAKNKSVLSVWFKTLTQEAKQPNARKITARQASGVKEIIKSEPEVRKGQPSPSRVKVAGSDGLNKKPKEFLEKWTASGITFTEHHKGNNPFQRCGNKFAMVAFDLFVNKYNEQDTHEHLGVVTKDDLINEFVDKFKWGIGTASSHTNIIFEVFNFTKVIEIHNGSGKLRNWE